MNAVIRMHASSLRVKAVTPGRGGRGTPPEPEATMRRTTLSIDGRRFLLAVSLDTEELEKRLVEAVRNRGDMVSFTVAGEREVCVLVSRASRSSSSTRTSRSRIRTPRTRRSCTTTSST